mgnify:CR=1 FL=1
MTLSVQEDGSAERRSSKITSHDATKMSKLQLSLLVVVGTFLALNVLVGLSHIYGPDSLGHNLAIHNAVGEFKKGGKPALSSSSSRTESNAKAVVANPPSKAKQKNMEESQIAKLSCEKYGGPPDDFAQGMVYWSDIPSDAKYVSPFKQKHGGQKRYMTFEPDGGGWNNIRMAMETVVGLAIATGR